MDDISREELTQLWMEARNENEEEAIETGINYHLKVPKKPSTVKVEICM